MWLDMRKATAVGKISDYRHVADEPPLMKADFDDEHPYGNNTLDAYAKRQGALDESKSERHLGLEDTHIYAGCRETSLG